VEPKIAQMENRNDPNFRGGQQKKASSSKFSFGMLKLGSLAEEIYFQRVGRED